MITRDMIRKLTKGKPFVFVIMAYERHNANRRDKKDVFKIIRGVAGSFSLACIRADEVTSAGHDLLAKIHELIDRAELVIAEITDPEPGMPSPNVFYEIGYAVASKKSPLLVVESGQIVPTDLQGIEKIDYQATFRDLEEYQGNLAVFKEKLEKHMSMRLDSELAVLRDMLDPPRPGSSFIVASPKYPGEHCRIKGQVYDIRTFGDNLGIMGLISAFGSMYGEVKELDLISGQHAHPDIEQQDISLYLIGSEKVNIPGGKMLEQLQAGRWPKWNFAHAKGWDKAKVGDWPVALYRVNPDSDEPLLFNGEFEQLGEKKEEVWTSDYGVIVRGPHPYYNDSGRLVLIMAGAHSLGTGAACLAATRSSLIRKLRDKLPPGVLEDKKKTFWALVKGEASPKDFLLSENGVTIEEAGVYD
jgi:hypothetical protein